MTEHPYHYAKEPMRFTEESMRDLFLFCVNVNASDITLQSNEPVFAEIEGQLHKVTKRKITHTEVGEMLNFIYGPNGTTQILSGQDVDTHYEIRPTRIERHRFRINGSGCQVDGSEGIQITARVIPAEPPELATLNLEPVLLENIAPFQGCVYITGATGSGKSTLLASIIRDLIEREEGNRKILTYESPIEFVFDSIVKPSSIVSQSEIPRHLPDFAAGVRNALRRKPMAILVGEARDAETISAVIEAALTGHPVYTTLHSNGVTESIRRLLTSFPSDERAGRMIDILETVRLVIWQKLVPGVDGKRIALREFLVFDETVRDELLGCTPQNVLRNTRELLKTRGQPMIVDATQKFEQGLLPEREFKILTAGAKSADKDVGI